jgi:stringent starvation protein A
MGAIANRNSVMTLISSVDDILCHRVRIVMAEKDVEAEFEFVNPQHPPDELLQINPSATLPTLVDRDLVAYGSQVIMEYLDERFPHPPLMPVDPVSRANNRLMISRIETDLYVPLKIALRGDGKDVVRARADIREQLTTISPLFESKPYFLSEEFTLVDCSMAALLWRLPLAGVVLPRSASALQEYADRIFSRPGFRHSLTEAEKEMTKPSK